MIFEESCAWVEAAQTFWGATLLVGSVDRTGVRSKVDPRQDTKNVLVTTELMDKNLLGIAYLPNGKAVPCGTAVSPSDDWLAFFLPLAGLELAYEVGAFPWGDGNRPWIAELNDWLVEIGKKVFCQAPFKIAAVGFEIQVSTVFDIDLSKAIELPQHRQCGLLVPAGQDARWYPSA